MKQTMQGGVAITPPEIQMNPIVKISIIVVGLLLILGLGLLSIYGLPEGDNLKPTHVSNVFVDVNGDGLIDLISVGEIIFNEGQPNFPQGQQNQP